MLTSIMRSNIIALSLTAIILPSCVQFSIGGAIKHPVKESQELVTWELVTGRVYQVAPNEYVSQVYESIQQEHYPIVDTYLQGIKDYPHTTSEKSGKKVWLKICLSGVSYQTEALSQAPDLSKAKRLRYGIKDMPKSGYVHLSPITQTSWWKVAAAAPFDYAIDPVLSIGGTVVYWSGMVVASPFLYVLASQSAEPTLMCPEEE